METSNYRYKTTNNNIRNTLSEYNSEPINSLIKNIVYNCCQLAKLKGYDFCRVEYNNDYLTIEI